MREIELTEDIKWLLKALPERPQDSRYALNTIYSGEDAEKNPVLVCSELARLHMMPNEILPPGLFTVLSVDKKNKSVFIEEDAGAFPGFHDLFSRELENKFEYTRDYKFEYTRDYPEETRGSDAFLSMAIADFFRKYPGVCSIKYLDDLGYGSFNVSWSSTRGTIRFEEQSTDRRAIIMPFDPERRIDR